MSSICDALDLHVKDVVHTRDSATSMQATHQSYTTVRMPKVKQMRNVMATVYLACNTPCVQ